MKVDFKEKKLPKNKKEEMLKSLIKLKEERNEELDVLKFIDVDDKTFLRFYYDELRSMNLNQNKKDIKLPKNRRNEMIKTIIKLREDDGKEVNVEGLLKLSDKVIQGIYYSEIEKNNRKFIPSNQYSLEDMLNDEEFQRQVEMQEAIEAYNNKEFDIPPYNRYDDNNLFDKDGFLDPNGSYDLNGRLLSDMQREQRKANTESGPKR